jgi:hypothetical protein
LFRDLDLADCLGALIMSTEPPDIRPTTERKSPQPLRWRPTFSLLTLLLVSSLVCVSVSHWRTSRDLVQTRRELRGIREEHGYLNIDDRSQVHFAALKTELPGWKWRIYLPPKHRWKLNLGAVPHDSVKFPAPPSPLRSCDLPDQGGQQFVLTVPLREMRNDPLRNGVFWEYEIAKGNPRKSQEHVFSQSMFLRDDFFVGWNASQGYSRTTFPRGQRDPVILAPTEPCPLLSVRCIPGVATGERSMTFSDDGQTLPTLFLWLEGE